MKKNKEKDPLFRKFLTKFILNPIFKHIFKIEIKGIENIPEKGKPAIIVANHVSIFDSASIINGIDRHIYYLGKKELLNHPFGRFAVKNYGIIPIDRGHVGTNAFKEIDEKLNEGCLVGIYPEGTKKGLLKGKKLKIGAISFAIRNNVPIIPVAFSEKLKIFGTNYINIGKPIYINKQTSEKSELEEITKNVFDNVIKLLNEEDKKKYLEAIAKRENTLKELGEKNEKRQN